MIALAKNFNFVSKTQGKKRKGPIGSDPLPVIKQVKPRFTTTSRATNSIKKLRKIFQFAWLMWLKKQEYPEEKKRTKDPQL